MSTYQGGAGNDRINQLILGLPDGVWIFGGAGDDDITVSNGVAIGQAGNDFIVGLTESASAGFWDSPQGIVADLKSGVIQDGYGYVDHVTNIHLLQSGNFDDTFYGSDQNDSTFLNGGNNTADGRGGYDVYNYYNVDIKKLVITHNSNEFIINNFVDGKIYTDTIRNFEEISVFQKDTLKIIRIGEADVEKISGFLSKKQYFMSDIADFTHLLLQMKVGDFNGDKKIDVLLVHYNATDIGNSKTPLEIMVGDGVGGFSPGSSSIFGNQTAMVGYVPRVFIADFNNDSHPDFILPDFGMDSEPFPGGQLGLYLSNQTGQLINETNTLPQLLKQNHGASTGDINGDGYADILINALNERTGHTNDILLNDGSGHFTIRNDILPSAEKGIAVNSGYTWSMLADINGDAHADMILGTWDNNPNPSRLYLNDGIGSFASTMGIALPRSGIANEIVVGIETIDLNGDLLPDLALSVTNGGDRNTFYQVPYIQLLVNQGGGSFVDETSSRLPQSKELTGKNSWFLSVTPVDLNHDGFFDLVTDNTPRIFMNDGAGHFTQTWQGLPDQHIVTEDVNSDGMTDIIAANGWGISTLINENTNQHVYRARFGGDTLLGSATQDQFFGAGGVNYFDGAAGLDTVYLDALRKEFGILITGSDIVVKDNNVGRFGTEHLANIERAHFSDGTLAFDTSGNAGQVYRLYQAAFARTPDTPGLSHNIGLVDGGLTVQQMSSAFLASAEFQQRYGTNVSDTAYINALYQNVLHRDADSAGLSGWKARLDDGSWSRTTLLIGFSESPENITNVAPAIKDGIWLG